jgi:hypothetical protein
MSKASEFLNDVNEAAPMGGEVGSDLSSAAKGMSKLAEKMKSNDMKNLVFSISEVLSSANLNGMPQVKRQLGDVERKIEAILKKER